MKTSFPLFRAGCIFFCVQMFMYRIFVRYAARILSPVRLFSKRSVQCTQHFSTLCALCVQQSVSSVQIA